MCERLFGPMEMNETTSQGDLSILGPGVNLDRPRKVMHCLLELTPPAANLASLIFGGAVSRVEREFALELLQSFVPTLLAVRSLQQQCSSKPLMSSGHTRIACDHCSVFNDRSLVPPTCLAGCS